MIKNITRTWFGSYGGQFVPETLKGPLDELSRAYVYFKKEKAFRRELDRLLRDYAGRPTPLYFAPRLTDYAGGAGIYLKREDLAHTGAHKINNTMGQVLLAVRMGKERIIAETGAGQHGVATATAAALFGLQCDVYMGEKDMVRQQMNVFRMELLGARVIPVHSGSKTLKDATNEAIRDWVTNVETTHYIIGSVVGPHPFPMLVRDFQRVVGIEAREQYQEMTGELPDALCACIGGGSNAIGLFSAFLDDECEIYGVEPIGVSPEAGKHAATMTYGMPGVIHGFRSYLLQDEAGEPAEVYSIASGLDYPGVGPEHAYMKDSGRIQYVTASDEECLDAFYTLSRSEGIIPALESAHAVAFAMRWAREHRFSSILVNLSGRGDKDLDFVTEKYGFPEENPTLGQDQ